MLKVGKVVYCSDRKRIALITNVTASSLSVFYGNSSYNIYHLKNGYNECIFEKDNISLKDIIEAGLLDVMFQAKIKERGAQYLSDDKVEIISKTDDEIRAKAYGTETYDVDIRYDHTFGIGMRCTCPYDGNCKHAYSAILKCKNATIDNIYINKLKEAFDRNSTARTARNVYKIFKAEEDCENLIKAMFADFPNSNNKFYDALAIVFSMDDEIDKKVYMTIRNKHISSPSFIYSFMADHRVRYDNELLKAYFAEDYDEVFRLLKSRDSLRYDLEFANEVIDEMDFCCDGLFEYIEFLNSRYGSLTGFHFNELLNRVKNKDEKLKLALLVNPAAVSDKDFSKLDNNLKITFLGCVNHTRRIQLINDNLDKLLEDGLEILLARVICEAYPHAPLSQRKEYKNIIVSFPHNQYLLELLTRYEFKGDF